MHKVQYECSAETYNEPKGGESLAVYVKKNKLAFPGRNYISIFMLPLEKGFALKEKKSFLLHDTGAQECTK